MFCEKCGAQLPDSASFCNKCGNVLRKKVNAGQVAIANSSQYRTNTNSNRNFQKPLKEKSGKGLVGIFLFFIMIAVVGGIVVSGIATIKKKNSIYGTWTDSNKTMTFTFEKSGNLRVSGAGNILGADVLSFTEENGVLHLQGQGLIGSVAAIDVEYSISGDNLNLNIEGKEFNLYRASDFEITGKSEEESVENSVGEYVEDFVEETLDKVQIYSLYGTWSDSYGAVSFTFQEDGIIKISGLEDTLNLSVFTFTEVDDDTLELKAESSNPLLGILSVNMDYEINGDTMDVSIAGKTLKLMKKDDKSEESSTNETQRYFGVPGYAEGDVYNFN